MFIPVPDSALAVVRFLGGGRVFSNTLWFRRPDFTTTDMETLASVVDTYFAAPLRALMHSGIEYTMSVVYDMRDDEAMSVQNDDHKGAGGQVTPESLPLNTAMVVTLYTGTRGRTGRGRIYLGAFVETQIQGGSFTTAHTNAILALLATFHTQVVNAGWQWGVVSRYYNGEPREEGLFRGVDSVVVRSRTPGTQRRRLNRP